MTLGNFATKLLMRTDTGITRLRGERYEWWRDIILVPTFHPAAALRGGEKVTEAMRHDFSLMREAIDIPKEPVSQPDGDPDDSQQLDLFS
jgi:uracil-DNA glycosylase family 4